jgi:L-amino acid N-acyltransferase
LNIRQAGTADQEEILAIYNEAVLNSVATFDTEPRTAERQKVWFEEHGGRYPLVVAEDSGNVIGWAGLGKWSDRRAYDGTSEISVYVRFDSRGKGVGTALMAEILRQAGENGTHTILARIAGGNEASIRLHESAGFKLVGIMREVGWKFGKWVDVTVMQAIFFER